MHQGTPFLCACLAKAAVQSASRFPVTIFILSFGRSKALGWPFMYFPIKGRGPPGEPPRPLLARLNVEQGVPNQIPSAFLLAMHRFRRAIVPLARRLTRRPCLTSTATHGCLCFFRSHLATRPLPENNSKNTAGYLSMALLRRIRPPLRPLVVGISIETAEVRREVFLALNFLWPPPIFLTSLERLPA